MDYKASFDIASALFSLILLLFSREVILWLKVILYDKFLASEQRIIFQNQKNLLFQLSAP
jgi:hypothetical protein